MGAIFTFNVADAAGDGPSAGKPASNAEAPANVSTEPKPSAAGTALPALPPDRRVPGGIAVIALPDGVTAAAFDGKRVMIRDAHAIVGLALSLEPGTHQLTVQSGRGEQRLAFEVAHKDYRTQRLTIKNPRMVDPSPKDLARIEREQVLLDNARSRFSDTRPATLSLYKPVAGPLSSSFGSRRILNDQPRNPHSGLDIAANTGSDIWTPAGGEVVAVGDFFFTGSTVIVDHGQGLLTMYCHLSRVDVRAGERVALGQRLGLVGATGRVTGAHLHWAAYLNRTAIDPGLLVVDRLPPRLP